MAFLSERHRRNSMTLGIAIACCFLETFMKSRTICFSLFLSALPYRCEASLDNSYNLHTRLNPKRISRICTTLRFFSLRQSSTREKTQRKNKPLPQLKHLMHHQLVRCLVVPRDCIKQRDCLVWEIFWEKGVRLPSLLFRLL